ncbi:MAG: hypothetical protein ACRDNS_08730 [Trebonia sp.]
MAIDPRPAGTGTRRTRATAARSRGVQIVAAVGRADVVVDEAVALVEAAEVLEAERDEMAAVLTASDEDAGWDALPQPTIGSTAISATAACSQRR